MSLWPILLRITLCIALILNGSVPVLVNAAHANEMAVSTNHQDGHTRASSTPTEEGLVTEVVVPEVVVPEAVVQKSVASHHDCHDAAAPAAAQQTQQQVVPAKLPAQVDTADHSDSCCADGDCNRGCTQHCAASIASALLPRIVDLPVQEPVSPVSGNHHAPRLSDLIRPPIV